VSRLAGQALGKRISLIRSPADTTPRTAGAEPIAACMIIRPKHQARNMRANQSMLCCALRAPSQLQQTSKQ
jgi:hypothetical protein